MALDFSVSTLMKTKFAGTIPPFQTAPVKSWFEVILLTLVPIFCGCAHVTTGSTEKTSSPSSTAARKFYTLAAEGIWQLDSEEERFDASGLLVTHANDLLTINDRNSDLFRIELEGDSATILKTGLFPPELVRAQAPTERERYDCEGIAQDEAGRLYICEEAERAIYRWDPATQKMEKLEIDWSPVSHHFRGGINASFEGIAVGKERIYIANERSNPLIIVVDLENLEVVDHFVVTASGFALGGPHYSDLSWFGDHLFVLDRNYRTIVQVEPGSHEIVAEFRFSDMEHAPEVDYLRDFPTGTIEGLAVTAKHFWLVTDNNGRGRSQFPQDIRPTLFRCPRPDRE